METLLTKKPGVYVFGLVLFAVLAVLVFSDNSPQISYAQEPEYVDFQVVNGVRTCPNNYDLIEGGAAPICQHQDLYGQSGTASVGDLTSNTVGTNRRAGEIESNKCNSTPNFFGNLGFCLIWGVGQIVFTILGVLVVIAAKLFGYAVDFNLKIAQYVNQTTGIVEVWSTIRDLANILFIFFLLWISIQTILGLDNAKKHLASIVVAALLINFSLFFTRIIIDTSNIVAYQFYAGIVPSQNDNLGEKILRATKLEGLYNSNGTDQANSLLSTAANKTNLMIIIVLGSIFLVIAAYALLNAAFMFIARVLVFIILLATSPIAFVQSILPDKMRQFHGMWWKNMWDQALVAPIFMLMIWIILKVSYSLPSAQLAGVSASGTASNSTPSLLDAINPASIDTDAAMLPIFNFLLIIGLLVAAVKVTKSLSGTAGGMITDFGGAAIGALAGGVGGFALRNTLGRAASGIASSERFKSWAATSRVGRTLYSGTENLAGASYDVRGGVPLVGGVVGSLTKQAGANVDFGKASGKGGYEQSLKNQVKERIDFAKKLDVKFDETDMRRSLAREGLDEGAIEANVAKMRTEAKAASIQRKEAYAENLYSRTPETLWLKVARKNKAAANAVLGEMKKPKSQQLLEQLAKEMKDEETTSKPAEEKLKPEGGPEKEKQ